MLIAATREILELDICKLLRKWWPTTCDLLNHESLYPYMVSSHLGWITTGKILGAGNPRSTRRNHMTTFPLRNLALSLSIVQYLFGNILRGGGQWCRSERSFTESSYIPSRL